jgi:hypothetical protein
MSGDEITAIITLESYEYRQPFFQSYTEHLGSILINVKDAIKISKIVT